MKLDYVSLRNFMCFDHAELDFRGFEGSPVVLAGENGSGKSAFLSAVCWAFTGKTLRGSPVGDIQRFDSKGGCEVSVSARVEAGQLQIRRFRGHPQHKDGMLVEIEGQPFYPGAPPKEVQKKLYELVYPCTEEAFLSGFYFSQGASGFFDKKDSEIKQLMDSILGVHVYVAARKSVSEEAKSTSKDIEHFRTLVEKTKASLKTINPEAPSREELHTTRESLASAEKDLWSLRTYQGVFTPLFKAVGALRQSKMDAYDRADRYAQGVMTQTSQSERDLARLKKERDRKVELFNSGKCPTCAQDTRESKELLLEVQKAKFAVEAQEAHLEPKRAECSRLLQEGRALDAELDVYDKVYSFFSKSDRARTDEHHRLNYVVEGLRRSLRTLEASLQGYESQQKTAVKALEDQLEEYQGKLEKAQALQETQRFWLDAFGPRGIRHYLAKSALPSLNEMMTHYLDFLGAETRGFIAEEKNTLVLRAVYQGRVVHPMVPSGGQKRFLNISVGAAITDYLQLGTTLYDEWFSELDESASQSVWSLLCDLAKKRTIVVSTHKGFPPTHRIYREGGVSKLQELSNGSP